MVYFGIFLFLLFVRLPILKLRLCFYVVLVNYYFFVLFCDMDYFVNISLVYKVINSTPIFKNFHSALIVFKVHTFTTFESGEIFIFGSG